MDHSKITWAFNQTEFGMLGVRTLLVKICLLLSLLPSQYFSGSFCFWKLEALRHQVPSVVLSGQTEYKERLGRSTKNPITAIFTPPPPFPVTTAFSLIWTVCVFSVLGKVPCQLSAGTRQLYPHSSSQIAAPRPLSLRTSGLLPFHVDIKKELQKHLYLFLDPSFRIQRGKSHFKYCLKMGHLGGSLG